MQAIKKNLKDQILTDNRYTMLCKVCGLEYSANKGDYWHLAEDYIFKCCDTTMVIVTKKVIYEEV